MAADAPAVDPIAVKLRAAKRSPKSTPLARGPAMDLGDLVEGRAKGAAIADSLLAAAGPEREQRLAREMLKTERLEQRQRTDV